MDERLPAHLEISGLVRAAQAQGGFATVIAKGERDAGTIVIFAIDRDKNALVYERMPQLDGTRPWTRVKAEGADKIAEIDEYLARRKRQDSDVWILELDLPAPEDFMAEQ